MKKSTTIAIALSIVLSINASAAEYFVSVSGNDHNTGTIESPFRTIQKAADIMKAGDICFVRGGTYRETVRPKFSGTNGAPIRFCAYPGEIVTLSGTEPVTGAWTAYKGEIYKTVVDTPSKQIFVDGEMMMEARWPNMRFNELLDRRKWATADAGSRYGNMVDEDLAKTNIDWTGALATLSVAHQFYAYTRTVTKHSPGGNAFTYDKDLLFVSHLEHRFPVWEDDYYFLSGKLEALDMPTEWFLDTSSNTLYLWTPKGDSPINHAVEAKVRDYAFDVQDRDYIEVSGFHFFGTTFSFVECDYCIVDNCHLLFPTYSNEIPETYEIPQPSVSTKMYGKNNIIRNSSLAYSSNGGVDMLGPNSKAENNLIHNINWSGSLSYTGIRVRPAEEPKSPDEPLPSEGGCLVRGNTVFDSGYGCIDFQGPGTIVEYNHTFRAGMLSQDVQCIGTDKVTAIGSIIRYNWVHNIYTPHIALGIRGDDQTRGLTIHHNVVWNTGWEGIIIKGDNNKVYNNTVFDIRQGVDSSVISPNVIHGRDPGVVFEDDIIPVAGVADIRVDVSPEPKKPFRPWQWPLLHQQNLNTETFNNCAMNIWGTRNKQDGRTGGMLANNYHGTNPAFMDPSNFDFRPKEGSPLIDQGRIIPGITDGYKGIAPDIGAYEYDGEFWIPGYKNSMFVSTKRMNLRTNETAVLKVALSMPPLKIIEIKAEAGVEGVSVVDGSVLKFTPRNWMKPQNITISAKEGKGSMHINLSADGMDMVVLPIVVE